MRWRRAGDVRGQKIAVLGAGPIGILLAQSAKALGAAQVLITDISTPRLELAKACGVDFAVNTKEHGFGEALAECFGPDKADVIYDCAGNDTTMGQAIRHCAQGQHDHPCGGVCGYGKRGSLRCSTTMNWI